jgi:hypothetical protein
VTAALWSKVSHDPAGVRPWTLKTTLGVAAMAETLTRNRTAVAPPGFSIARLVASAVRAALEKTVRVLEGAYAMCFLTV